jgi:hypothetical protein
MYYIILFLVLLSSCETTKFCYQCKHYKRHPGLLYFTPEFGHCSLNPKESYNNDYLVTGNIKRVVDEYHYCSTARKFDDMCGPFGKNYEYGRAKWW